MTKAELRKKYKNLRKKLTQEQIEEKSLAIANNVLKLPIWDYSYYHIFLPIKTQHEVNTEYLLHILQGKDKHVVVSKSDFNTNSLSHYLLTDTTALKENTHGITEPIDGIEIPVNKLEVVFIPLLAYDKKGNRVGYGKGFYDTFLNECSPNTIKIGLSFFEVEEKIDGITESDEPLDYCATSDGISSFDS